MIRYLQAVAKEMEVYPPKQNPNGYQRTGRLRRGWTSPGSITVSADGSEGTLINPVLYAAYAQGPKYGGREIGERQTKRMQGLGWKSISDVARKTRPRYVELMNRAIKGTPGA